MTQSHLIPTLDDQLKLLAVLLNDDEVIIYTDIHGVTHLIAKEPVDFEKEYGSVKILNYQDLGMTYSGDPTPSED